jgi:hypothetical protein
MREFLINLSDILQKQLNYIYQYQREIMKSIQTASE